MFGGTMRTGDLTAGPDVYLAVENNSSFDVGRPMTIDHSEVNVTPNTDFRTGLYGVGGGPTTISQGNITGSYSVYDKVPIYQDPIFTFGRIYRDLVVITKFPYDGGPIVRLR